MHIGGPKMALWLPIGWNSFSLSACIAWHIYLFSSSRTNLGRMHSNNVEEEEEEEMRTYCKVHPPTRPMVDACWYGGRGGFQVVWRHCGAQ